MRRATGFLKLLFAAFVAAAATLSAATAQIELDRGLRIGELWVFPTLQDPKEWTYLPASARLSLDERGEPQFSFLIYVKANDGRAPTPATITQADGGAVVNFMVEYFTPPELVEEAQSALRRRFDDDEIKLERPIIFENGEYHVISSVLNAEAGGAKASMLAAGRAPLLEGGRVPLSFRLNPDETQILLASLNTRTSDISIAFDMAFSGINAAYDADLYIDWSEARSTMEAKGGVNLYYVKADIEAAFDEMRRDNAIRLEVRGDDTDMEGLLTTVYDKLLELMFRPAEPAETPERSGDIATALATALGGQSGALNFGAYGGYKVKEMRSSGVSTLSFNKRATAERHTLLSVNVGDLYTRYGERPDYFRVVNMSDPTWDQREVRIAIDGSLVSEFDRFVNQATVVVRKTHGDGSATQKEIVIDSGTSLDPAGQPKIAYLNKGDDPDDWLSYDYRVAWSFFGGGKYTADWQTTDSPLINLYTPYRRQPVELVGEPADLAARGVRAVYVKLTYDFFGAPKIERLSFRPDSGAALPSADLTLPNNVSSYDYEVTWALGQDRRIVGRGRDDSGFLFIDEIPEE